MKKILLNLGIWIFFSLVTGYLFAVVYFAASLAVKDYSPTLQIIKTNCDDIRPPEVDNVFKSL